MQLRDLAVPKIVEGSFSSDLATFSFISRGCQWIEKCSRASIVLPIQRRNSNPIKIQHNLWVKIYLTVLLITEYSSTLGKSIFEAIIQNTDQLHHRSFSFMAMFDHQNPSACANVWQFALKNRYYIATNYLLHYTFTPSKPNEAGKEQTADTCLDPKHININSSREAFLPFYSTILLSRQVVWNIFHAYESKH